MKVCYSGNGLDGFPDIHRIGIDKHKDKLTFEHGKTGSGGNSGFQALNLAVQWGAKRVLLIGYDMNNASGFHWYGMNNWNGANNPNDSNFRRWIAAFDNAAVQLKTMGVSVVNCAAYSALNCFPKMTLEDALVSGSS